jgi:hemolysin D
LVPFFGWPIFPFGIAVTVEIKIGKRRVIDYFLSPVLQYGNESVRER